MQLKRFEADTGLANLKSAMEKDGALTVNNLLCPEVLEQIDTELTPFFDTTPTGEGYFWGKKTRRMGGLFVKSPGCRSLALDPRILAVVEAFLKPYCDRVQINLTQAIQIDPGEPAQVLHRDDEVFPCANRGMELMMNVLLAMDDFTTENGATQLVLGSHRDPEICREPNPEKIVRADMPRGSVLIYLGSITHGGGANISALPRRALALSYSLGWLKQAENQYLANPPHIAAAFPPALQQLVGYQIHTPNLGWYEGQDPRVVLTGQGRSTMAAQDFLPAEAEDMLKERYNSLVA